MSQLSVRKWKKGSGSRLTIRDVAFRRSNLVPFSRSSSSLTIRPATVLRGLGWAWPSSSRLRGDWAPISSELSPEQRLKLFPDSTAQRNGPGIAPAPAGIEEVETADRLIGRTILVVEDDPAIQLALDMLLRDWGLTVFTASSLEAGSLAERGPVTPGHYAGGLPVACRHPRHGRCRVSALQMACTGIADDRRHGSRSAWTRRKGVAACCCINQLIRTTSDRLLTACRSPSSLSDLTGWESSGIESVHDSPLQDVVRDEQLPQIDRQTGFLLPPSVDEWLPERHLARFVVEVIDGLDLRAMSGSYRGSGSASYHPTVLLGILVYGYATGVFSSRKLERATYDLVAFRFIAANDHPDHDTIATFRRRFLRDIERLFVEVLLLAREMGVLTMGTVGLDGTKIHANASRHSALVL